MDEINALFNTLTYAAPVDAPQAYREMLENTHRQVQRILLTANASKGVCWAASLEPTTVCINESDGSLSF